MITWEISAETERSGAVAKYGLKSSILIIIFYHNNNNNNNNNGQTFQLCFQGSDALALALTVQQHWAQFTLQLHSLLVVGRSFQLQLRQPGGGRSQILRETNLMGTQEDSGGGGGGGGL